jgi:hypothetical protein
MSGESVIVVSSQKRQAASRQPGAARKVPVRPGNPSRPGTLDEGTRQTPDNPDKQEASMLKFIGWAILIIFIIGLLVVIGIFDLIF